VLTEARTLGSNWLMGTCKLSVLVLDTMFSVFNSIGAHLSASFFIVVMLVGSWSKSQKHLRLHKITA